MDGQNNRNTCAIQQHYKLQVGGTNVMQMLHNHCAALAAGDFLAKLTAAFFYSELICLFLCCFFGAVQIKTAPAGLWIEVNECLVNTITPHNQLNPSGKHTYPQ